MLDAAPPQVRSRRSAGGRGGRAAAARGAGRRPAAAHVRDVLPSAALRHEGIETPGPTCLKSPLARFARCLEHGGGAPPVPREAQESCACMHTLNYLQLSILEKVQNT